MQCQRQHRLKWKGKSSSRTQFAMVDTVRWVWLDSLSMKSNTKRENRRKETHAIVETRAEFLEFFGTQSIYSKQFPNDSYTSFPLNRKHIQTNEANESQVFMSWQSNKPVHVTSSIFPTPFCANFFSLVLFFILSTGLLLCGIVVVILVLSIWIEWVRESERERERERKHKEPKHIVYVCENAS